tara:strand:+ start:2122 stop:2478 length:357 start_codon:yes stop_codon:yes gene_type:complete
MTPEQYEELFTTFSFNNPYLSDDIVFTNISGTTHIQVITTYVSASTVYMSNYLGYPGDIYDPIVEVIGNSIYAGLDTERYYDLFYKDSENVQHHLESFNVNSLGELNLYPVIPTSYDI